MEIVKYGNVSILKEKSVKKMLSFNNEKSINNKSVNSDFLDYYKRYFFSKNSPNKPYLINPFSHILKKN